MHRLKLLGLALIAVLAVGGSIASAAMAEAAGSLLLVLPGEKVSELTFTGTAEAFEKDPPTLENAAGEVIQCTKLNVSETFEEEKNKPADSEKDKGTLTFTGCKKGELSCRSEAAGVKDPIETILVKIATLGYSGLTAAKVLVYGVAIKIEGTLVFVCGTVKVQVKGALGCPVSPALEEKAAESTFTILCQQAKGVQTNQPTVVENAVTKEELAKEPLLATLNGKEPFTAVGELIHVKGTFNKMVILDD